MAVRAVPDRLETDRVEYAELARFETGLVIHKRFKDFPAWILLSYFFSHPSTLVQVRNSWCLGGSLWGFCLCRRGWGSLRKSNLKWNLKNERTKKKGEKQNKNQKSGCLKRLLPSVRALLLGWLRFAAFVLPCRSHRRLTEKKSRVFFLEKVTEKIANRYRPF